MGILEYAQLLLNEFIFSLVQLKKKKKRNLFSDVRNQAIASANI